jgi:hypothetical protein
MSNNNSVPGMMYPTQKGMPAGNPRDSAIQNMNSNQQNAALASKLLSGGKGIRVSRKKRYGGTIAVPQYQMLYESQGGPGTNPNNQIQGSAQTSTQMAANSALDSGATKMGGYRRRRSRKGGNPDWVWGCLSGGKKRTRKMGKKSRKSRRNRKQ